MAGPATPATDRGTLGTVVVPNAAAGASSSAAAEATSTPAARHRDRIACTAASVRRPGVCRAATTGVERGVWFAPISSIRTMPRRHSLSTLEWWGKVRMAHFHAV